jgi:hypothetical protein
MKKTLLIALVLLSLSASSQSVTDLIEKRLENVSKPFQFATVYGTEFATAIIDGAVTNPDEIKVGEYKLSSNGTELTYYSPKYKLVIYLKEEVDSLDFTRIYSLQ